MGSEFGDTFVERRMQPRLPVKLSVGYRTLERENALKIQKSASLNISASGIAMRSSVTMAENETIQLELFIPIEAKRQHMTVLKSCPENECKKITILSRIVWCRPWENGAFLCGTEFLDMPLDDQEYLNQFLLDYRIPEPDLARP